MEPRMKLGWSWDGAEDGAGMELRMEPGWNRDGVWDGARMEQRMEPRMELGGSHRWIQE